MCRKCRASPEFIALWLSCGHTSHWMNCQCPCGSSRNCRKPPSSHLTINRPCSGGVRAPKSKEKENANGSSNVSKYRWSNRRVSGNGLFKLDRHLQLQRISIEPDHSGHGHWFRRGQ